jgi:hypothetical protein
VCWFLVVAQVEVVILVRMITVTLNKRPLLANNALVANIKTKLTKQVAKSAVLANTMTKPVKRLAQTIVMLDRLLTPTKVPA